MEFYQILNELRKERKITQTELAKNLNVSNGVISFWETKRNEPTLQMIKKLALYFNVSTDYLLGLEDDFGNKIYEQQEPLLIKKRKIPNKTEEKLLQYFKKLDLLEQGEIIGIARTMLKNKTTL